MREIKMPTVNNFDKNPMLGDIEWDYLVRMFSALQLDY
jgi:hypothetical protein